LDFVKASTGGESHLTKGCLIGMFICLEAGLNMFDSADVYSAGLAEEILGQAIAGRRAQVLISTKATFRLGDGPIGNDMRALVKAILGDALLKARCWPRPQPKAGPRTEWK
jgi:hypothetical protein